MSRSVEVELVLAFMGAVVKAIEEIGLAREEVKAIETHCGEVVAVDFVVRTQEGDKIGIKQTESGDVQLIAADPQKVTTVQTMNQIKQTYARIKVMEELQRKGYRLTKEEKTTDGRIRLVVQRWQ